MFSAAELFDLSQTQHAALFEEGAPVWRMLSRLQKYLAATLKAANHASVSEKAVIGEMFI